MGQRPRTSAQALLIPMTVLFVTRTIWRHPVRSIVHRAAGTLAGLTIAAGTLHFQCSGELTPGAGMLLDYPAHGLIGSAQTLWLGVMVGLR